MSYAEIRFSKALAVLSMQNSPISKRFTKSPSLLLMVFASSGLLSFSYGQADAKSKEKAEAEPSLTTSNDDPGCRDANAKAAALFASGKNSEAADLLRQWKNKCTHHAQLHLLLSTILLRLGNAKEEAEESAKLATQIAPNSVAAHMQHALTLLALDKTSSAKDEFERITQIDPSSYDAWTTLADLYGRLNERDKAKAAGEKAAILDPQTRRAKFRTLHSLRTAGKADGIRQELARLLNSDTEPPEFFDQLASEALSVGAYTECVQAANRALSTYPKSVSTLKAKLQGAVFSNNLEEARAVADQLLKENPDDYDVLALKSITLVDGGNIEEADGALKKAQERGDKKALVLLARGKVAAANSQIEDAIKNFQQALAGDQSLVIAHAYLADAFIKSGQFEEGLSEAKECLRVPGLKMLGSDYESRAKEGLSKQ